MTPPIVEPPRLAESLLEAALPPGGTASTVLGDLREELSLLAGLLFAVSRVDGTTYAAAASYLPASRASRLDPALTLRRE